MNLSEIKGLVEILEGSSLNYMEVSEGNFQVKIGKGTPNIQEEVGNDRIPEGKKSVVQEVPFKNYVTGATVEEKAEVKGETEVTAPMVGVFYAAPSPEAEAFVTEGQTVKQGQVLCIIEAMKLMNEIHAEKDGIITEVCVSNGEIVEFGQPLFRIQ